MLLSQFHCSLPGGSFPNIISYLPVLKSIKFEVSFGSCPRAKNDVTTSQFGLISTAVLNLWVQRFRVTLIFGLNWIGDVIFRQVGE
jgi:hypothetical protein